MPKHVAAILASINHAIEQLPKDDAVCFIRWLIETLNGPKATVEDPQWHAAQDTINELLERSQKKSRQYLEISRPLIGLFLIDLINSLWPSHPFWVRLKTPVSPLAFTWITYSGTSGSIWRRLRFPCRASGTLCFSSLRRKESSLLRRINHADQHRKHWMH